MDNTPQTQMFNRRLEMLRAERASWVPHWQELSQYILPRNGRFFLQDRNRGMRRHNNIYDSTGTRAARVMAAGMLSGASSPARPWFRLGCQDQDLMKYAPVRLWFSQVTALILDVFAKSNTYRSMHSSYEELGVFGTAPIIMNDNYETVINLYNSTVGEYFIAANMMGVVDTFYREYQMQVAAMVDPKNGFGLKNCSFRVKEMYERGQLDQWITIVHVIEPRHDRNPASKLARDKPWKSVYYEQSEASMGTVLRESGYDYFPVLAPRWAVLGGDIYGNSPGMEALGDIKQLQHQQVRKGQAIDYQVRPPLLVPTALKGRENEYTPGGVVYYNAMDGGSPVKSLFDVNLNLSYLTADIKEVQQRIDEAFYVDLFQTMNGEDMSDRMTATEVSERHEEKLLILGPVVERLHNEMLAPLVENTFMRLVAVNALPPPPPELSMAEINIEFISVFAQAQRAIGINSIDRFTQQILQLSQIKPDVLDKFDQDAWADIYSDDLGIDPTMIIANDKVAVIRGARQKAQAQAQQAALQESGSKTMANLGKIPPGSPASDIMSGLTGYSSPQTNTTTQGA